MRLFYLIIQKMYHVIFISLDQTPKLFKKKFLHFFSRSIRISGKNVIFNDKKINKSNFSKNKKLSKIDDIDVNKIVISKKEAIVKKVHLNTSL